MEGNNMTATWALKLGRKTATWALKAWEQTKAEVESEQPLGSGMQHIFLSPSGFLQLVCFRWVRPGSLAEQQKTYIYIYVSLVGKIWNQTILRVYCVYFG